MGSTSFMQEAFLGGEISQAAQGRVSHPLYRMSMNKCINAIPMETGTWQRRPGNRHVGFTRQGKSAKIITFDFQETTPVQMEFTDGVLRFWADGKPVTSNNKARISSISAATPALMTTFGQAGTWNTGQDIFLSEMFGAYELLNRQIVITVVSPTTFLLTDGITGQNINGAALSIFVNGNVTQVFELNTPYVGGSWANLRSVQAETTAVLLNGIQQPQILTVTTLPNVNQDAQFALAPSDFLDGPYLKAIKGSYISAADLSGVTTLTLSFQTYDATVAYDIGDYVTSASLGYRSLTAANQGHTPVSSPTNWLPVNAGDPINNGVGFTTADIGRLIRLFSQPALWAAATAYVLGNLVTYTDQDDTPGYWQATGPVTGTKPGTTTLWTPVSGVSIALWTWARVLSISGAGLKTPDTAIGTLTGGGGIAAAFDGSPSKGFAGSANHSQATATYQQWAQIAWPILSIVQYSGGVYQLETLNLTGVGHVDYTIPPPLSPFWGPIGTVSNVAFDDYVGQHFSSATQISSATVTPSTDVGFTNGAASTLTLNLRANSVAPGSASDGTLLGTTGVISNTLGAISIGSSDQSTAWHYVWIEEIALFNQPLPDDGSHSFTCEAAISQVQFYAPNIANGSVISAQIVGPALLYASTACRSWRLGVFGGANGWPTCGTYSDGRLWLAGVVGNRIDSSKSDDKFNFAPTAASGAVADDNAISAVFDAPDVNDIFWMHPEQQGIICGTQAGEWLVFAPGQGAMSPTNIDARRVTKIGCANIEPRRTDHTLVLVQKFLREIMEYFADVYSGKFAAPSINERAKHLTITGVQEIAYQQELASIVWARRSNGLLIGTTYKRDSLMSSQGPNIAGAHQHVHGGSRLITSMAVGGTLGGTLDALYMVTQGGDGLNHIEIMTPLLNEGFLPTDVWQVDDGIAPAAFKIDSTPIVGAPYGGVRIYGLWPHNGKTVQAWLAGLDCGVTTDNNGQPTIVDFVVANGSIFVPFGDGNNAGTGGGLFTAALVQPYANRGLPLPGCVGFTFTSDGQIVRPATAPESGTQAGPGFGKLRRAHQFGMLLYGAINGSILTGVSFDDMLPVMLKQNDNATDYTALQLFNGITRAPINASNDFDNMLCWRITRPVPAWVVAVGEFLHTQDI